MTVPFVSGLRARPETIVLPGPGTPIQVRVELAERWDVVRISASPAQTVLDLKRAALAVLAPGVDLSAFLVKLRGSELVHELETLAEADVRNGSIFLVAYRRRRPVR